MSSIDLSIEINEDELFKQIEKKLHFSMKNYAQYIATKELSDRLELELKEKNIYSFMQKYASEHINCVVQAEVSDQLHRFLRCAVPSCIGRVKNEKTDDTFESGFYEGAKAAYLVAGKMDLNSEEIRNEIIESAGKELANRMRMDQARYKRLIEVLKQEYDS